MEKIVFDSGIKEFKLGNLGVLRFNPGDPNLYARFLDAAEKIRLVEKQLLEQAQAMQEQHSGEQVVRLMQEADRQMKDVLGWVFGAGNDFDKLLGGVNLLAVGSNGERVVTNLFAALQPVLVAGAEKCAQEKKTAAVQQAKARRAAQ